MVRTGFSLRVSPIFSFSLPLLRIFPPLTFLATIVHFFFTPSARPRSWSSLLEFSLNPSWLARIARQHPHESTTTFALAFLFRSSVYFTTGYVSSRVRFDKNRDCEHSCRYRYIVAAVLARLSANRFRIFSRLIRTNRSRDFANGRMEPMWVRIVE